MIGGRGAGCSRNKGIKKVRSLHQGVNITDDYTWAVRGEYEKRWGKRPQRWRWSEGARKVEIERKRGRDLKVEGG